MDILIVYISVTGNTEKCARILGQKLKNTTIVNLMEQDVDISKYDMIIVGSPIRIGMFNKTIKKFINNNKEILINKKVAYYICCGFNDSYQEYFKNNMPKELLDAAVIYDTFGGEMDLSKQKGLNKFIVSLVSKNEAGKRELKILSENIDKFVEKVSKITC